MKAWVALGSNLGDRQKYLEDGLKKMRENGLDLIKVSSIIETKAYGNTNQGAFLNAVCQLETSLSPHQLLDLLLSIEKDLGRVRLEHWGPRTLDLDILFYENEIIEDQRLSIPHPDLTNRSFVLGPLKEISPDLLHPLLNKTIPTLYEELKYKEALDWIEKRARFGIKLGLDNIKALLAQLGNPQEKLKCIHIAGTNGKGSTSTYIASVLEETGYKTGLFTSPFIETFRERFQINQKKIPKDKLLSLILRVKKETEELELRGLVPTHFEILTAICFKYFADEHVDFAVIEVGLGGLYDSTNVLENPLASIITTIDFDHMEYLGSTLKEIAIQKAGIIKDSRPVFVYPNEVEAMTAIEKIAAEKNAPLFTFNKSDLENIKIDFEGSHFSFKGETYHVSMIGYHQAYNASLAIFCLQKLKDLSLLNFSEEVLRKGLKKAKIIARMEVLQKNPYLILDGAHNPQGARALAQSLTSLNYKKFILGLGILKDKDHKEIISLLAPLADQIIASQVVSERNLAAEDMLKEISLFNKNVILEKDIKKALDLSLSLAGEQDLIVWAGSLYLMGNLRKIYFNR